MQLGVSGTGGKIGNRAVRESHGKRRGSAAAAATWPGGKGPGRRRAGLKRGAGAPQLPPSDGAGLRPSEKV